MLVASTDGVGTKIQVAILAGVHDTVGYDLVAHCVNDILVQGAVPLFFLDYIALGRMDPDRVEADRVRLRPRLLPSSGARCIGGETAEMPGHLRPRRLRPGGLHRGRGGAASKALTGAAVQAGDVLVGLPSAGLHTNGYTLARKVLFDVARPRGGHAAARARAATVGEALLAPHRSYLAALEPLLERRKIRALAHITGGGFAGNIPRVLPEGLGARIRRGAWQVPPLFRLIQKGGSIPDDEMFRTFNMGVGMIAVVAPGGPARRRALARAPRRDRVRDGHRGGGRASSSSDERRPPPRRAHQRARVEPAGPHRRRRRRPSRRARSRS